MSDNKPNPKKIPPAPHPNLKFTPMMVQVSPLTTIQVSQCLDKSNWSSWMEITGTELINAWKKISKEKPSEYRIRELFTAEEPVVKIIDIPPDLLKYKEAYIHLANLAAIIVSNKSATKLEMDYFMNQLKIKLDQLNEYLGNVKSKENLTATDVWNNANEHLQFKPSPFVQTTPMQPHERSFGDTVGPVITNIGQYTEQLIQLGVSSATVFKMTKNKPEIMSFLKDLLELEQFQRIHITRGILPWFMKLNICEEAMMCVYRIICKNNYANMRFLIAANENGDVSTHEITSVFGYHAEQINLSIKIQLMMDESLNKK
jgi:hypothetical protein